MEANRIGNFLFMKEEPCLLTIFLWVVHHLIRLLSQAHCGLSSVVILPEPSDAGKELVPVRRELLPNIGGLASSAGRQ